MDENTLVNLKWYQKNVSIILFLLFLFPVGLLIMWKYSKWNKNLKIILSIIFSIFFLSLIINVPSNSSSQKIYITSLSINNSDINIELNKSYDVQISYFPINSNDIEIEFRTDNNNIVKFEKNIAKSQNTTLYGTITGLKEENTYIYVKDKLTNIISPKITVKVIDSKKISENKIVKEKDTNTLNQEATNKTNNANKVNNANQTTSNNTSTTTQKDTSATVYITPTGKRYHYSSRCAGKNASPTTKQQAISSGFTPCKKCAK